MYISSIGFRLDYQKIVLEKIELTTVKIFYLVRQGEPLVFWHGSEINKANRCYPVLHLKDDKSSDIIENNNKNNI